MKAFLVDLDNKPGTLAAVAEALGAKGVNIKVVSGASCGTGGRAAILTADDAGARSAFSEKGISFKEMEATEVSLADRPGSLGKAARRLAEAAINIEAIFPTGMSGSDISIAFVTDNPTKAREVLAAVGSATR